MLGVSLCRKARGSDERRRKVAVFRMSPADVVLAGWLSDGPLGTAFASY